MTTKTIINPVFNAEQKAQTNSICWELGENRAPQLTNYGLCSKTSTPAYVGSMCALNAKLVRGTSMKTPIVKGSETHHCGGSIGCDENQIRLLFKNVYIACSGESKVVRKKITLDLIIMMFNLRDVRGEYGRGERTLTYWMFLMLYNKFPETMISFMTEIPNYGSWVDLNNIYILICGDSQWSKDLTRPAITHLKDAIANVYAIQIKKDLSNEKKSLAAKWIPKEGRSVDKKTRMGKHIAKVMYPDLWAEDFKKALRAYRSDISKLTVDLDVVERKMSASDGMWSEIDFDKVPGRCMAKHTKAWSNRSKTGEVRSFTHDREQCSTNYMDYIGRLASGKTKAKGKAMFVHELAMKLTEICDSDERILYESMMDSHVDSIAASVAEKGGDLGNTAIIADVSGSMCGDPMAVSYAIAVIASHPKIANPAWANIVMTFSDNPEWVRLQYPATHAEYIASKFGSPTGLPWNQAMANRQLTWTEKLRILKAMPWGGSTNFISALNLVAVRAIEAGVKMPNLMCISDMQWNCAASTGLGGGYGVPSRTTPLTYGPLHKFSCSSATMRNSPTTLLRQVKEILATESCGADFTTIMWNVRGGVSGHAGAADEANFVEVAGFSTSMLNVFLNEGTLGSPSSDSGAADGATSWSTLRTMLDHTDYDRIREIANLVAPFRNVTKCPITPVEMFMVPVTIYFGQPKLVRSTVTDSYKSRYAMPTPHGSNGGKPGFTLASEWSYDGGDAARTNGPNHFPPANVGGSAQAMPPVPPANVPTAVSANVPTAVPSLDLSSMLATGRTVEQSATTDSLTHRMDKMEAQTRTDMDDIKSMMAQLLKR